jgi:hypothetical protein
MRHSQGHREGDFLKAVSLEMIAHARSGDKGNRANIGLLAREPQYYSVLIEQVTAERVKQHFAELCRGPVERFELPNLFALNFVMHDALDGGGTVSLRADAQGKTLSSALLRMMVTIPE